MRDERLREKEMGIWELPWFPSKIRLPSNTNTIQIPDTRYVPTFSHGSNSTLTLAHPDEPYMQKYDKFVETPIPRAKT